MRKLAEADGYNKESRQVATQARDTLRDLEFKVGMLESRLAETQNQRLALEALYLELSRSRDERVLAEVEQILLIGSQQLQLAGNVKAALIALESADSRLQRADSAQFTSLRRAIRRDTERLKSTPYVDVVGMSLRLDTLAHQVDSLAAGDVRASGRGQAGAPRASDESAVARLAREAWEDLQSLIRIQRVDSRRGAAAVAEPAVLPAREPAHAPDVARASRCSRTTRTASRPTPASAARLAAALLRHQRRKVGAAVGHAQAALREPRSASTCPTSPAAWRRCATQKLVRERGLR